MNPQPAQIERPLRARSGGDGIRLQIDRSDAKGWVDLAVDMKPNFTDDLSPLPAAGHNALWTYRAIYLLNDADFGQWSDPVSVSVAG